MERDPLLTRAFVLCSVASIPLWLRLSRGFGKRNVWLFAMVGAGLSFGLLIFIGEGDFVWMGVLLVCAGIFSGCGGMIGPSILADVIDADEHATGQRKEGAYSAAWGFAIKSANAAVILLASLALQLSDFTPNAEQTPGTLWMLRLLNGGAPLVMFLIGALVFRRFSLTEREHARLRAELDAR